MVLPPSAANDASGPATPGWLRRLKVSLGLSSAGLLVLVDHARPERLGELVRALLPIAPELEVHTEAHRLAEARPGATLVLVPRAEDADWLNINRPLFASRALRVVLFCTREVSVALSRGAVDFLDWVSLRLECPAGPAPYAVAGLRLALAARVPGIVWTGGDLEASFAAARPHRVLRRISAARPYEELVAEAKAAGPREWLAWTDVDGEFRLRRVRWALAEARRRTRAILVEPTVHSPGWWEVHGRVAEPAEACEQLRSAGAKHPGRLAALVDLEPEAIQLLSGLLERGDGESSLEEELLKEAEPGAAVGRLASEQGLVTEKELVHGRAPPPAMRAFGAERDRMQRLHETELNAIERRVRQGEQVDAEDAAWWSARTRSKLFLFMYPGRRGEVAEVLLRETPQTGWCWEQVANIALDAGDADVAHLWALRAVEADKDRWKVLTQVLAIQGRYTEAESFLRRQLQAERTPGPARGWILHELGWVLEQKGQYAEAEKLLRQSLSIKQQALGTHHRDYGASLHALAGVLEKQGQYAEAEKLLRQSLSIKQQALGTHHPDYGASLHALAGVLEKQGQYAEAEKLLRQSLSIIEQALGTHHRDYGASLHALAGVLEKQDQYAEAEKLLRQSLSIIEQALGSQHPRLCSVLASLGSNLAAQNRPHEGEVLLLRSASLANETWGPQHPETAQVLTQLARVQSALKKPEAATTAQRAMDALIGTLGPEHPITKDALPGLRLILTGSA